MKLLISLLFVSLSMLGSKEIEKSPPPPKCSGTTFFTIEKVKKNGDVDIKCICSDKYEGYQKRGYIITGFC